MRLAVLTDGLAEPEGPAWDPDGTLFVVEMSAARVTAIAGDGTKRRHADTGGRPTGLARGADGFLYVANNGGGTHPPAIQRIDASGRVECLYDHCDGRPLQGPNDLVMDAHGGFYFTDPGFAPISRDGVRFGHVYYAKRDGSAITRLQYYFYLCNGIALTPDGAALIVLESLTSRIFRIPIESPGVLAQVDAGARAAAPRAWPVQCLLAAVPQPAAPDGMCLDEAGHLLVCAHGAGVVCVYTPDGTAIGQIPVDDRRLTNCCFGGRDHRTLYVTELELGRVVTVEWERRGLRLHDTERTGPR